MASGTISFSGIASSIDTDSIVEQLVTLASTTKTKLETKKSNLQEEQTAVKQVTALVTALRSSVTSLQQVSAFTSCSATSSNTDAATASANTGATAGTHTLKVTQLAKADTFGSATKSSKSDALGVSGQFLVNGVAITVTSDDTLTSLAEKINDADADVTANIVMPSSGQYRMVLTSDNTGADQLSLSEVGSGTILTSTLGFLSSGSATAAHAITGGYASDGFSSSSTSIATMLGITSPASGTVQINGTDVSIDLGTDTLSSLATKIQAATGLTTTVSSVTNESTGATEQRIEIAGATSFTDSSNILANLGFVQRSVASDANLIEGQNAKFVLDGVSMERSSNTISDAIENVTLYLQDDTDTPTTKITVAADTSGVETAINNMVSAYNNLVNGIANYDYYDSESESSGVLFGNYTISSMMDDIANSITGEVSGLSGGITSIAAIGITLDEEGLLSVDSTELEAALSDNLTSVKNLFQSSAITSNDSVTYVGSTSDTVPSGSKGYVVSVTQPATKGQLTASIAHTANDNATSELLTFSGIVFGSTSRGITIAANSTLQDIVNAINKDSSVSAYVSASIDSNRLLLTSKVFGSAGTFRVQSDQAAAANNSGIGSDLSVGTGLDVEGTVNGELMTGSGQLMIGTTGNATTEGLQLRVTASTAGQYGTVIVSKGVAVLAGIHTALADDTSDGTLTELSDSLTEQITDLEDEIESAQESIDAKESFWRQQFTAMEEAIANLQDSSSALSGITGYYKKSS